MVRGAAFGFVPSTINDLAFHHATLDITELIHVSVDTATISSINAVANILLLASKISL
jgi:hypothetical protein